MVASHAPPTGDLARKKPVYVPCLGVRASNPLDHRPALSPLSHTSQGTTRNFYFKQHVLSAHCALRAHRRATPDPGPQGAHSYVRDAGKSEGSEKKPNNSTRQSHLAVRTKTDQDSVTQKKENIYFYCFNYLEISMFL